MSDIDFDELDRAVNSLITSTPAPDAANGDSAPTVPVPTPAAPAVAVPDVVAAPVAASQPATSTPTPAAPAQSLAGQRSSGRFMDVIHPSSDMRTSVVMPDRPAPVPVSSPVTPPSFAGLSGMFSRTPAPVAAAPREVAATVPERTAFSSQPLTDDAPVNNSSLESPFIPGAKVEKRPLGAFSNEPETPAVELSPSGEVIDKSETPEPAPTRYDDSSTDDINSPLPEEFRGDLLQIESGNAPQTETPAEPEKSDKAVAAPAFESAPTGPVAIVQQYTEKPAKTDEKSGAIYDTNVYHKALSPEDKKKSGWLWILWIVILLVVGVGAGAIAYFYVLPLL